MKVFVTIGTKLCWEQYITPKKLKSAVFVVTIFIFVRWHRLYAFPLKTFSVEQNYQKPNSFTDNIKQITDWRSVLKVRLLELVMSKFRDCSRTLLWQQLNMLSLLVHDLSRSIFLWAKFSCTYMWLSPAFMKNILSIIRL